MDEGSRLAYPPSSTHSIIVALTWPRPGSDVPQRHYLRQETTDKATLLVGSTEYPLLLTTSALCIGPSYSGI